MCDHRGNLAWVLDVDHGVVDADGVKSGERRKQIGAELS
jgi:hypothetical protein